MHRFLLCLAFALVAAIPARADSIFTVKNVPVDATAAASVEAQTIAINGGRPKAWAILYRRLTRQDDWAHQPPLDDAAIGRLIRTFDVTDERRSTTRYVAKVTYVFSQPAVERLLRANNISYVVAQTKRILVIPLSPNFAAGDSWSLAWADPRFASGFISAVLPEGGDADALSGMTFDTANWNAVSAMAARLRVSDVVVADLAPGNATVRLKRLAAGQPIVPSVEVPGKSPSSAADAAFGAIADFWKNKSAVDFSQKAKFTAEAKFSSLSDWASLQSKLGAVQTVVGIDMIAFSINEARVDIAYVGSFDQLKSTLADTGISMTSRDGIWWLARADGAPQ
ncbi:MAG TPA: hypothetical protein VGM36_01145 [Rhizomicrobium sp.]|jgi:hypothetical protein